MESEKSEKSEKSYENVVFNGTPKSESAVSRDCGTAVRFILLAQSVQNGFGVVPSVSDGAVQNVRDGCPEWRRARKVVNALYSTGLQSVGVVKSENGYTLCGTALQSVGVAVQNGP